ncbi:hypothetical protein Tco_0250606 [Tanacetum coccineum]
MKKKKLSQGASNLGIFNIELYCFPSTSWVYDTGCGTHICITTQGLRGSRKLKQGTLSLYMGDGHRAAVKAIREFICVFLDGFVNCFENDNSISVSRNNLIYFNVSKYIFESMIRNLDNMSGKFLMYPRKPKRKDTQVPQPSGSSEHVADEAVHKELGDSLVRAATAASSLEAEQDNGNITKTRSKATPNESSSLGTTSGGGLRGNTLQSDEDSLKLKELMELRTNLQQRVLYLEKTKTTQQNEIASLKRRVKKLEQKKRSRTHGLKRLHKVGMSRRVESFGDEDDLGEDASKPGEEGLIAKGCRRINYPR